MFYMLGYHVFSNLWIFWLPVPPGARVTCFNRYSPEILRWWTPTLSYFTLRPVTGVTTYILPLLLEPSCAKQGTLG